MRGKTRQYCFLEYFGKILVGGIEVRSFTLKQQEGKRIKSINLKHSFLKLFQTGASIAQAAEAAALTAAQEAKRAAFAAQEMMKSAKEAADKAKRARQIAEAVQTS